MEETKICPHCGSEILATAKKCKHCGNWLEKKCPACDEWVNIDAKKCKHCGTWFSYKDRKAYDIKTGALAPQPASVPADDDDEGNETLEEVVEGYSSITGCLLSAESLLLGGLLWYVYDWKWWQALIAYFIFTMLMSFQILRIVYCLGAIATWFCIGYAVYDMTGGLVAGVVALLFHLPAFHSKFDEL
ncbi:zinc ribbon domain-containing protein [Hallella colorans]|uniref:zinc ribbon domain-containing protein n=1 Tax=Hallella colorans TaxID=1703337 RepID=UPI0028898109|nr:zinc ribbon domain-containing protein [Hallella colorans]